MCVCVCASASAITFCFCFLNFCKILLVFKNSVSVIKWEPFSSIPQTELKTRIESMAGSNVLIHFLLLYFCFFVCWPVHPNITLNTHRNVILLLFGPFLSSNQNPPFRLPKHFFPFFFRLSFRFSPRLMKLMLCGS